MDPGFEDHAQMISEIDVINALNEYRQARGVEVKYMEMNPGLRYKKADYFSYISSTFHMSAIVDGQIFPECSCPTKKEAKKMAALRALLMLYDQGKRNLQKVNTKPFKHLELLSTGERVDSHADRVVLLSREILDRCQETQFMKYTKNGVVATFILEQNGNMSVVGLGTGTRCILSENLSSDGQRVIHFHAEIIARRAFLRYLYKQLLMYDEKTDHPILTQSETGKLKLRDELKVHLHISRPPCGDASTYHGTNNSPNKWKATGKQGRLRTVIGGCAGTIPTDSEVQASADGNKRLRVMTCSDKICRWNVLGIQGALLSHFMDPIYLDSLVIGSHRGKQMEHVPRAISGRLECGNLHEVIQPPFCLNNPEIECPRETLSDTYKITKTKKYSKNWTLGDEEVEVLDPSTGKVSLKRQVSDIRSRVSKLALFELFHQVCTRKTFGRQDLCRGDYAMVKKSAKTFQRMKRRVGEHFDGEGFGRWLSLQETRGTDSFSLQRTL